jgi:hypothetical protein
VNLYALSPQTTPGVSRCPELSLFEVVPKILYILSK